MGGEGERGGRQIRKPEEKKRSRPIPCRRKEKKGFSSARARKGKKEIKDRKKKQPCNL